MPDEPDGAGPAQWAADVVLRDGSILHIRPIRPSDAPALQAFHEHQSPESVYFRFFAPHPVLSEAELARLTQVDHDARVALVLVSGSRIVGVGRYDRLDDAAAEVAFHVADPWQGRGLGSVLLEHLAAAARERGVARFVADVLPGNVRMINVFRDAGYEVRQAYEDGVLSVTFDLAPTERSLAVMAEREQHADAQSMRAILGASSVLVVGAGTAGSVLARRVAEAILAGPFHGPVHLIGDELRPVAAAAPDRAGRPEVRWHAGVSSVGDPVDLAALAVPAERLPPLLADLGGRGVQGAVVLGGADGAAALRAAREAGVRMVGPESFGLVANGSAGRLNATLRRELPAPGGLSLFCQSAAAGLALLEEAQSRGLGLRAFLSAGQRADVSGNDALQLWVDDAATTVVGVHLESIGNPRKFSRVARRLSARKPLVALVDGQTGQAVPAGHRVRTTRQPRRVLDELLRQAGVLSVTRSRELLDLAQLLTTQPLPAGDRVAVLATSPSLADRTADVLRGHGLAPGARVVVPPDAGAHRWREALEAWASETGWASAAGAAGEGADALVVAYVPLLGERRPEVVAALASGATGSRRPVLALVHGLVGCPDELPPPRAGDPWRVPAFESVEDAAHALAAAVRHRRWVGQERGRPLRGVGVDQRAAGELVAAAAAGAGPGVERPLAAADTDRLLAAYGIRVWPALVVESLAEAGEAGESLGWPVAVKSDDERLRHRLDLGGVRLDVGPADLPDALGRLDAAAAQVGASAGRHRVQAMAPRGVACVVSAVEDDLYGPVVSFGLAGDAVELLDDVAYLFPPATDRDVAATVRGVRAAPRLLGHRGLPAVDVRALEDVVGRVAMLKDDLPQLVRLVLNPVLAAERGAAVLEARAWVGTPARLDPGRRVLPA